MNKHSKKHLSTIILFALIIVSLVLITGIVVLELKREKELCKEFIFNVKLHTSDTLYIQNHTDKPFIIYLASHECDACVHEIIQLSKKIDNVLKQYNILFITERESPEMVSFLRRLKICPNFGVFTGTDDRFKIRDYYKIENIPTILILDKNFIARKKLTTIKPLLDKL